MQAKLVAEVHLDVAARDGGAALGVEGDEIEARSRLAGHGVGSRRAMLQKLRQKRAARTCHCGPAHLGRWYDPVDRRFGVVVELRVFREGSLPVADVGLVPQFPLPRRRDIWVTSVYVRRPRRDEVAPFGVVGGRVEATTIEGGRGRVLVRRRIRRQRLGHEPDLGERESARSRDGIHDSVHERPRVDRIARSVLGVHVRRSPLERWRAVAGIEEKVRANVRRGGVRRGDGLEQRFAFRSCGVVDLVVAVVRPDALKRRSRRRGIDRNRNGLRPRPIGKPGAQGGCADDRNKTVRDAHGGHDYPPRYSLSGANIRYTSATRLPGYDPIELSAHFGPAPAPSACRSIRRRYFSYQECVVGDFVIDAHGCRMAMWFMATAPSLPRVLSPPQSGPAEARSKRTLQPFPVTRFCRHSSMRPTSWSWCSIASARSSSGARSCLLVLAHKKCRLSKVSVQARHWGVPRRGNARAVAGHRQSVRPAARSWRSSKVSAPGQPSNATA